MTPVFATAGGVGDVAAGETTQTRNLASETESKSRLARAVAAATEEAIRAGATLRRETLTLTLTRI